MSVAYCQMRRAPSNYESFGLDKLAHRQRQTYFARRHKQRLMKRANESDITTAVEERSRRTTCNWAVRK